MQAYKSNLTANGQDGTVLDESIKFLEITSSMIELFSDSHAIYEINDPRLCRLKKSLDYFNSWKAGISDEKEFFSSKLWYDLKSTILGFLAVVRIKISKFPGSLIKPMIVNQDLVENHFSQLRGANSQNENPTYLLAQSTQNSIILG